MLLYQHETGERVSALSWRWPAKADKKIPNAGLLFSGAWGHSESSQGAGFSLTHLTTDDQTGKKWKSLTKVNKPAPIVFSVKGFIKDNLN